MPKHRVGLQKDFSAIFDGVWIPKKIRVSRHAPAPASNAQEMKMQMEEIIRGMNCQKDFECIKSGFEKLCKAKIIGNGKLVECSPENQQACEFRFFFTDRSFCKCRLRYYIAKNFQK